MYKRNKYSGYEKISFSQCGEDLIMDLIFYSVNIDKPTYLDFGASHPFICNNTYLFYLKGSSGVNIEPDPSSILLFHKYRNRDINLPVFISNNGNEEISQFYFMSSPKLNTIVKDEAIRIQTEGVHRIKKVAPIKVVPLQTIFVDYFNNSVPDLLSFDIRAINEGVLTALNLELYRPKVFCLQKTSKEYSGINNKFREAIEYLSDNGYLPYANTHINEIFVDSRFWDNKQNPKH